MGVEIERKFLVIDDSWKAEAGPGTRFCQGSIARHAKATVRVRQTTDKAFITIKGARDGISRAEFEYEIPSDDAAEMLGTLCQEPLVEKVRYRVPHVGLIWEVDVYAGQAAGLVLAEVELQTVDTPLSLPSWIGAEVTEDRRFHNSAIGLAPEIAKSFVAGVVE